MNSTERHADAPASSLLVRLAELLHELSFYETEFPGFARHHAVQDAAQDDAVFSEIPWTAMFVFIFVSAFGRMLDRVLVVGASSATASCSDSAPRTTGVKQRFKEVLPITLLPEC